jgi:hypothetical protein
MLDDLAFEGGSDDELDDLALEDLLDDFEKKKDSSTERNIMNAPV